MNKPSQASKRIVSKGEYSGLIFRKAILGLGSIGLAIVTGTCFAVAILLSILGFVIGAPGGGPIVYWGIAILIGCLGVLVKRVAETGMEKAIKKENVVPLTNANTAHLPVSDSLVRPAEPYMLPDEAQAMLLRAVTQTQERHEEQLVRAVEAHK